MGLMDRIRKVTGTEDNYNGYTNDDDYYNGFENDISNIADDTANAGAASGQANAMSGSASPMSGISLSGTSLELKVVKPQHFDSVPQIADHLLNKRTVVLNLENTNKETARRLIDFLSGVAYSINGSLKKIASNAYVITPENVDVGDAQLRDKRSRAEAQQSTPTASDESVSDAGELGDL